MCLESLVHWFQEKNPDQLWTSRIYEHLLCEQQFEVSAPTSETSNRFFFFLFRRYDWKLKEMPPGNFIRGHGHVLLRTVTCTLDVL